MLIGTRYFVIKSEVPENFLLRSQALEKCLRNTDLESNSVSGTDTLPVISFKLA